MPTYTEWHTRHGYHKHGSLCDSAVLGYGIRDVRPARLTGQVGRIPYQKSLLDIRSTDNVPLRIFAQLKHYSRKTSILGQNVSQLRSWLENGALSKDGKTDHCGTT